MCIIRQKAQSASLDTLARHFTPTNYAHIRDHARAIHRGFARDVDAARIHVIVRVAIDIDIVVFDAPRRANRTTEVAQPPPGRRSLCPDASLARRRAREKGVRQRQRCRGGFIVLE